MKRFAVTPFLFCSLLALAVTACGDDGGGGEEPDAQQPPVRPDAMDVPNPPDAGPDVPPDAAPPPEPELVVSATALTVNEGNVDGATLTVKLSAAPSAAVTVTVASSDAAAAAVDPASLTFDAESFGTEQTVTVTAPNDANANNATVTVTLSGDGLESVTVEVTVIDDDALNILADPTTLTVDEGDDATFGVALTVEPNADVTVNVASSAASAAVDVATLTFTPDNYDEPQTVTVSGVSDDDVADEAVSVTLSSDGLTDVTVAVTVADDDTQTIQTSAPTVGVDEGGTGSFTVRLSNDPLGPVEVTVASSNGAKATASPSTLTFDSSNYADPQTVTVTGVDDADVADHSVTFTLSATDIDDATVTANVDDDDTQTIQVNTTTSAVDEGSTGQFTVRLSNDPLGSFTVTLTSTDPGAVTTTPTSLTFDSSNYTEPQTVTVNGVGDADRNNESVPVRLSGNGVSDVTVTVSVADTTPPFAVNMFVRVSSPASLAGNYQLIYQGNNRYRVDIPATLPAVINFKIGDSVPTAGTIFAGSATGPTTVTLGANLTLVPNTNVNHVLLLIDNRTGNFTFRFELNATSTTSPVLTVTQL